MRGFFHGQTQSSEALTNADDPVSRCHFGPEAALERERSSAWRSLFAQSRCGKGRNAGPASAQLPPRARGCSKALSTEAPIPIIPGPA